jgi:hypothetical protein
VVSLSPGVRRLCICVSAPYPGLLARACRAEGVGRLYTERIPAEDADLGFAVPGVDEAVLVPDLISALREAATEACAGGEARRRRPALVVFHVGITRVEGDDLRGRAVTRLMRLAREIATAAASGTVPVGTLVVGMTAGLFDDIGPDCDFSEGWFPLRASEAWCRVF